MTELVEGLAREVGTLDELVLPKPNSLTTQDYGVRYSPEGACLPFKLLLGSLMESMDLGADMVGMITERGPCRLGMYSVVMRLILEDCGRDALFFDLNNSQIHEGYIKKFRRLFRGTHKRRLSLHRLGRGFLIGCYRLAAVERLEMVRNSLMALEREPGSVKRCFEQCRRGVREARTLFGIRRALHRGIKALRGVPVDRHRPTVQVVVTGEAYCTVDAFANCDIERLLASMGAEPVRVLWQTNYLLYPLRLDWLLKFPKHQAIRASRPYLPEQLGGDVNSNVGFALMATRAGLDGMIHLKPFGCMMEFISENILKAVSRDTGLPIISLSLDDMRGEERLAVRLEAFVDKLFERRRRRKDQGRGHANRAST
ncbi:MAG: hypothetical protein ACOC95_06385 [Planctomycetota bacterium]